MYLGIYFESLRLCAESVRGGLKSSSPPEYECLETNQVSAYHSCGASWRRSKTFRMRFGCGTMYCHSSAGEIIEIDVRNEQEVKIMSGRTGESELRLGRATYVSFTENENS
jgi:hypothetical protein